MNVFQVTLQRGTDTSWPVVAMDMRDREKLSQRSEGVLVLDLAKLRACVTPNDYGLELGKALFRDDIRDAFARALAHAHEEEDCLRVLLTVEDPLLRALHWERLWAPFDGKWKGVSLNQDTPFSLDLPSQADRSYPPTGKRDLSALALVAGPQDLSTDYHLEPLNVNDAVKLVRGALGAIPCDILASPVRGAGRPSAGEASGITHAVKGPPNLNKLCERLTAGSYTILHILCHGRVGRDGETQLYLPGDDNRAITGSTLIERLGRVNGQRGLPQFVFLMACDSASPDAENGLGGLAQRMVRELGIPAVLAMTAPVSMPTADALVTPFYEYLFAHGEPDRALAQALAGLPEHSDITAPAVFSRLAGRPLFTDELDSELSTKAVQRGADRLAELVPTRAPVLELETNALVERLRKLTPAEGLSGDAQQVRAAVLEKANQLSLEILDLSFNALALDRPVPEYDARCPFRGLAPFRREDREFFFGRETLLAELKRRLEEYPFLAILGESGSGKSSLVQAGLLPDLDKVGEAICISPGSHPAAQLESALAANPNCTTLIIDQFEEIFTLCHDGSQRQTFIDRLLNLKESRKIILAMRADFLGECAPYDRLREEIQRRQEIVAPLDFPGLRRVMEQQAGQVGLRFEGGLAEMILDEVTSEPGAMCLLQHALLRLWERRHGRLLCVKEYKTIGGVGKAIAQSADQVYSTFDDADKERVRDIFLRMTRLDTESAAGREHRDTRRRVEMRELVPAGSDPEAISSVVNRLADGRLVVTSCNAVSDQDEVEMAHEALIRYWPRLSGWLKEDRAGLRLRESIRAAAVEWEAAAHDPKISPADLLTHRGPRLDEARALPERQHITLNAQEQRYLDACLNLRNLEHAKERLRNRILIAFMAVVTISMAILAIYSVNNALRADASAAQAKTNQQAAEVAGTAQAHSLQTAEAARGEAVAARNDALAQKAAAEAASLKAASAQATAEASSIEAEKSKKEAEQQARSTRSRELAALSMAHQSDNIDLALLLAVEGWTKDPNFDAQNALLSGVMSSFYMEQVKPELNGSYPVMAYNAQGTRLAAGGSDGKVYLLNTATKKVIATLASGAAKPVASLAFSPDGALLASSDETGITLWDGQDGTQKTVLPASDSPQIAFENDEILWAGTYVNQLRFWKLNDKPLRPVPYYPVAPARKITCIIFSPLGQLAIGTEHGVYLWMRDRWTQDRKWNQLSTIGSVSRLSFSQAGYTLAVSDESQKAIVLLSNDGSKKNTIPVNTRNVQMAFKPDGNTAVLAYVDANNAIQLVNPLTGAPFQPPMKGHVGPVNTLAFGPNGQIATDGEDRFILWNSQTDQQYTRPLQTQTPIRTFAISADGATLAVVDIDNTIHFYPVGPAAVDLTKEKDSFKPDPAVRALAVNQDGLVAAGTDTRLLIFDAQHKLLKEIVTDWKPAQLLFSADGKTLIAADPKNGRIKTWDAATRSPLDEFTTRPFDSFTLTTDGRFLVTAWEQGHVQVREAKSGLAQFDRFQVAMRPTGDAKDSEGIWTEISADGKFLFIHDYLGGVVRVFYIPTQQQVYELSGWAVKPGDQVVSPNGFMSVSRSGDRALRILSLDPDSLKTFVCQKAGRNLTQPEWATFFPAEAYHQTCGQWEGGK